MSKFEIFYKKNDNAELFSYFSDNSKNKITKMQNYIPIYSRFFSLNETNHNKINLNNKYSIKKIKEQETNNKFTLLVENNDKNSTKQSKKSFFKFSPLIDATKYMAGKYKDVSQNIIRNLPKFKVNTGENTSKKENTKVLKKIECCDNSAYTDSFFSFLSSQLLNTHKFSHGIDFYGSFLGIKHEFKYDITDDLEYLYDYEYFHENKDKLFKTDKIHEELMDDDTRKNRKSIKIGEIEEIKVEEIDNDIFKGVFEELTTGNIEKHNKFLNDIKISNIDYFREKKLDNISDKKTNSECSSRESQTSNEEDSDLEECDEEDSGTKEKNVDDEYSDEESYEDSDDNSDFSIESIDNIFANIKDFPCQIICLEQLDNTLDSLLVDKIVINDNELTSCFFQVVMTLLTYQKSFDFTHNDLHTNNIMFQKTDKKFINYRYNEKYYRVPTYGKLYKIIDFGRAIYKFNGKQIISDCFYNKGEADGQYNFSILKKKNKKEIQPNKGFDLCRLGCSLYDYFIEDVDDEIKRPIVKLISDWTTDDNGKNILYKANGEERYPDFKLYKMITRKCSKNTPEEQLKKDIFKKYISSKNKIKKSPIINIDKIPIY